MEEIKREYRNTSVESGVSSSTSLQTGNQHPILDWAATLVTVFLCGATLCPFMRWCSAGQLWDLGGFIFSGIFAFLSYRFTLSEKQIANLHQRTVMVLVLPLIWVLFFPILLFGLGFK